MKKALFFLILLVLTKYDFNAQTQARLVLPIGHKSSITSAAFSSDDKLVLTASDDNTARILYNLSHNLNHMIFYNLFKSSYFLD